MLVLGLTGGIGMGKSTVARMFARAGVPVFDADAVVHALQAPGGRAIPALARAFPGTVHGGVLDRRRLRDAVLQDAAALRRLELIMHPLVQREAAVFRAGARRAARRAVVMDIPLLFETGGQGGVQKTIVVSAPRDVQIARVRRRGTMDAAQIAAVIAKQMPDSEKRLRADYVIATGLSKFHTWRSVLRLLKTLSL